MQYNNAIWDAPGGIIIWGGGGTMDKELRCMKAKELARYYLAATTEEEQDRVMQVICNHFFDEVFFMLRQRNPSNDAGAIAILRELNTKWIAMSRLTNGEITENGFLLLVSATMPQIGTAWAHK